LVRYYTDRHETELFPFIVTVLQLSLAMFAVLLVPLDIYLADAAPANGHIIEIVYYSKIFPIAYTHIRISVLWYIFG